MFELVITKFRPTEVLRSRITHSRPASGLNPFPPRRASPRGGWCVWVAFLGSSLGAILLHAPFRRPGRLDCSLPLNILNIGNIESIART